MIDIESRIRYGIYFKESEGFTTEEIKEMNRKLYEARSNSDICLMDDNSDDRPVQFVESERDGFEAFSTN